MFSGTTREAQAKRREEIYAVHRKFNRKHFRDDGRWTDESLHGKIERSREMLWHAMAFLAGDADDVALGNAIIRRTPNVANHFNGVAAASIWLHYEEQLDKEAIDALRAIINDLFPEMVDFGLGIAGVSNYSSMLAWFFLAASQRMEMYEVPYKHRSISEVYNRFRMRRFGLNMLYVMKAQLERTDLAMEFNSPTYSPITLWGISQIARLSDHQPARELASWIERSLWRELLAFHHPGLGHNSGPHSRAYMVDSIGHSSNWRLLCSFLGIDNGPTVEELIYTPQRGQVITGELAFRQSLLCWLIRAEYRVPQDLLDAFGGRSFPYEFEGGYEWAGQGFQRPDGTVVTNVDGDYLTPGGVGRARCYQDEDFSISSMSETNKPMNHPCQVVYRLRDGQAPLGSTRSITTVMLTGRLDDGEAHAADDPVPWIVFANNGRFRTEQTGPSVKGTVEPHHWSPLYGPRKGCGEISFNLFVSEHLPVAMPVEKVTVNGRVFEGVPVDVGGEMGTFEIVDGRARVEARVRAAQPVRFRVWRQCGFLRCAVVLYEGPPKMFGKDDLARFKIDFEITVRGR